MKTYKTYKSYKNTGAEQTISAEDKALNKFAEMLIKKIEEIQGNWECPWFKVKAGMLPQNIYGTPYNGLNTFFLYMCCEDEGYKAPIFVTFEKVSSLNYDDDHNRLTDKKGNELPFVGIKKGETSFPVFYYTFIIKHKETGEKVTKEFYNALPKAEQDEYTVRPYMRVVPVFNIDQTTLSEARPKMYQSLIAKNAVKDEPKKKGKVFSFAPIDSMIELNGWLCPIECKKQDGAYYTPSKDKITLPLKSQFKGDESSFYTTALHEMAHSTGAASRLNRELAGHSNKAAYGREELVAEMSSAVVANMFGMSKRTKEESLLYLKGWLEAIKQDPKFIRTIMVDVKNASRMMYDHITGYCED